MSVIFVNTPMALVSRSRFSSDGISSGGGVAFFSKARRGTVFFLDRLRGTFGRGLVDTLTRGRRCGLSGRKVFYRLDCNEPFLHRASLEWHGISRGAICHSDKEKEYDEYK